MMNSGLTSMRLCEEVSINRNNPFFKLPQPVRLVISILVAIFVYLLLASLFSLVMALVGIALNIVVKTIIIIASVVATYYLLKKFIPWI